MLFHHIKERQKRWGEVNWGTSRRNGPPGENRSWISIDAMVRFRTHTSDFTVFKCRKESKNRQSALQHFQVPFHREVGVAWWKDILFGVFSLKINSSEECVKTLDVNVTVIVWWKDAFVNTKIGHPEEKLDGEDQAPLQKFKSKEAPELDSLGVWNQDYWVWRRKSWRGSRAGGPNHMGWRRQGRSLITGLLTAAGAGLLTYIHQNPIRQCW